MKNLTKEYTIKFYIKKAGSNSEKPMMDIFSGNDKKEAFKIARQELVKFANIDLSRGLSESSELELLQEIESIKNGSNSYCYDQTTWLFKVFSKSVKSVK